MRKIIALITMLGLLSFACSENDSIVSPNGNYTEDISLAKKGVIVSPNGLTFSKEIDGKKGGKIDFNATIDGPTPFKVEASLKIPQKAFKGKIVISLTFNPDSPTVEFGPEMSEFEIDEFKELLKLSLKIQNKWFKDDNRELRFVYFNDDGSLEDVIYSKIGFTNYFRFHTDGFLGEVESKKGSSGDLNSNKVGLSKTDKKKKKDKDKDWMFVKNARLEHFSRYGFTK